MKKFFFTAALLCLAFANQLFSQDVYFQISGGYGFSTSENYLYISTTNSDVSSSGYSLYSTTHKIFPMKEGKGLWLSGTAGYQLSPTMSLELMLGWKKMGSSIAEYDYRWNYLNQYYVQFNEEHQYKGQSFVAAPQLKFRIPSGKNNYFFKAGLLFSKTQMNKHSIINIENTQPGFDPTENYTITQEYKQDISIGFVAGTGYELLLGGNWYLVPEIAFHQMQYVPSSAEITEYIYKGRDELNELSTSEKEIIFVEEYNEDENNENKPRKELKAVYDLSNFSLKVGIKLQL